MKKIIIIAIVFMFFLSCKTSGNITLANNDSGTFFLDTEMTDNLYKTMTAFGDIDESGYLFSSDLVKSFFTQAGLSLSSVIMKDPQEIAFTGTTNDITKVLEIDNQPVTLTKNVEGKKFRLLLDENTIMTFMSLLSEESLMYIDLLQAPLFSREEMTAEEYEEFIAALYGKTLSNDLKNTYVNLVINIPKSSIGVSVYPENLAVVEKNAKNIVFNIKLSELLANHTEAYFEVLW